MDRPGLSHELLRMRRDRGGQGDGGGWSEATAVIRMDAVDATDCDLIGRFHEQCRQQLCGGRARQLVVDLGNVERVDTKLVACLVSVLRQAAASRVRVEMVLSSAIHELTSLCRLDGLFDRSLREGRAA